jgi:hypothetical protein
MDFRIYFHDGARPEDWKGGMNARVTRSHEDYLCLTVDHYHADGSVNEYWTEEEIIDELRCFDSLDFVSIAEAITKSRKITQSRKITLGSALRGKVMPITGPRAALTPGVPHVVQIASELLLTIGTSLERIAFETRDVGDHDYSDALMELSSRALALRCAWLIDNDWLED